MGATIQIIDDRFEEEGDRDFLRDINHGLSMPTKRIPSKYFYDANGSKLFNEITRHPDYYLTNCELDILTRYKQEIAGFLTKETCNLIELGPGEGIKTSLLLDEFMTRNLRFTYYPVDISRQYLIDLEKKIAKQWPRLDITGLKADYLHGIQWLTRHSSHKNLVLFLGSSIGNYDFAAANQFLRHLWQSLNHGDYLLIGFDLRKDIHVLTRAYNDSDGITRQFNLNLLRRMNTELDANFIIDQFEHYGVYNVHSGAMESYLLSRCEQDVVIGKLNRTFHFHLLEPIHVEYSFKYLPTQIAQLAHDNGFQRLQNFTDSKNYFIDSLWQVDKSNTI
ncbi:L-histidine N(alpha)-methyltransferase [Legionella spiritensis]|uniref:L-histidine N(alpha)-methyltransferase n=1 Tax=Legionella spiritensis TaxID=452 RepID=UPI000F6C476B|nr:L-histidine N(alpha)-methyltransferase [Legionella spiritensis]VEG90265.1 Histidine-specific methyltransferase EgtD [Legionella spiritensis]